MTPLASVREGVTLLRSGYPWLSRSRSLSRSLSLSFFVSAGTPDIRDNRQSFFDSGLPNTRVYWRVDPSDINVQVSPFRRNPLAFGCWAVFIYRRASEPGPSIVPRSLSLFARFPFLAFLFSLCFSSRFTASLAVKARAFWFDSL